MAILCGKNREEESRLFSGLDGSFELTVHEGYDAFAADAEGRPTGIAVQLSKNWHTRQERRVIYDGAWFHGSTVLRLQPKSETELELAIAYARWGGVPAR